MLPSQKLQNFAARQQQRGPAGEEWSKCGNLWIVGSGKKMSHYRSEPPSGKTWYSGTCCAFLVKTSGSPFRVADPAMFSNLLDSIVIYIYILVVLSQTKLYTNKVVI